ncbi:MAG: efflux RND transporter periplasmic adaptor subunit [Polyangia bacterium]
MTTEKRFALAAGRALVLALGACWALACQPQAGESEEEQEPSRVETSPVETGTVSSWLGYIGDIEGEAEVAVFSAIPDRIIALNVLEGDEVERGDVLAVIHADVLRQGVRQALGGLDAARAQRDALADQVSRFEKLEGSGAVTSSQLISARSQLAAAEARVRQLEATLGQARERKGDSRVRAPISGVVGRVMLEEGDMAVPQTPICTVVAMDRVRVGVDVPEPDLPLLEEGQLAEVRVAVSDGPSIRAKVSRVGPVLDRVSRTAPLEIDIDNPDHELKPGMLARVRIQVERRENVVVVPKMALTVTSNTRDGENLFRAVVVEDGRAVERLVSLGIEEGERVEVLEGLSAGERLVVSGQHLVADGDQVLLGESAPAENESPPAARAEVEPGSTAGSSPGEG